MKKLEVLKLVEITTTRQANNGTRSFMDPITDRVYSSYASGYVRVKAAYSAIWQLNKTRSKTVVSASGIKYVTVKRILIADEIDRLERLAHCVATQRKNILKSQA